MADTCERVLGLNPITFHVAVASVDAAVAQADKGSNEGRLHLWGLAGILAAGGDSFCSDLVSKMKNRSLTCSFFLQYQRTAIGPTKQPYAAGGTMRVAKMEESASKTGVGPEPLLECRSG